jgi:molybdopterin converting factor small subunit
MNSGSTITVQVPGVLREYCQGASALTLTAPTVRAALDRLERDHASLHRNICDETGKVRRHVNVFVNSDNTRDLRTGLDTPLVPGDVVTIMPAVSGG